MNPATLSIRLSVPKPISAMDDAAMPAPTAMANSMKCQPIPPQARSQARRTRRSRSSLTLSGAALTLSSLAIGKRTRTLDGCLQSWW